MTVKKSNQLNQCSVSINVRYSDKIHECDSYVKFSYVVTLIRIVHFFDSLLEFSLFNVSGSKKNNRTR